MAAPLLNLTPKQILKAIPGTRGRTNAIAKKLGVKPATLARYFRMPGQSWNKVRRALNREQERIIEIAEDRVEQLIRQDVDKPEAGRNARWILSKKKADTYGEKKTVTLEGNKDKPLELNSQSSVNVDLLPIELRRQILQELEAKKKKEKEQNGNA